MVLYVRSKGDPRQVLAPVEREMRAAGPQILLFGIRTGQRDHRWRIVPGEDGSGTVDASSACWPWAGEHRAVRSAGVFGESAKARDRRCAWRWAQRGRACSGWF